MKETKWLGSVGICLFDIARNWDGIDLTGSSASQQRLVRMVSIWLDIGGIRLFSADKACSKASNDCSSQFSIQTDKGALTFHVSFVGINFSNTEKHHANFIVP